MSVGYALLYVGLPQGIALEIVRSEECDSNYSHYGH